MISVIVPIYNAEKRIERCVKSIQDSLYSDIEILLVNDGSTDQTAKVCEEISQEDERIKIITTENNGVGLARQRGLEEAKGEYIAFVDSDDWVEKEYLSDLIEKIQNKDLDICISGYTKELSNDVVIKVPVAFPKDEYTGDEIKKDLLNNCVWYAKSGYYESPISTVWMAMYKKEIIDSNNISFYSEREYYSEDSLFNLEYLSCSHKVGFLRDEKYHFVRTGDSLSSVNDSPRFEKIDNWYSKVLEIAKERNELEFIVGYVNNTYFNMYKGILDSIVQNKTIHKSELSIIKKRYSHIKEIDIKDIADSNAKKKILFWLIKKHVKLYALLKYKHIIKIVE